MKSTMISRLLAGSIFVLSIIVVTNLASAELTVEKSEKGAVVKIDGELFTEHVSDGMGTPICWPVIGPTGKRMTREYPLADALPTEKSDHIHHRSLWFTHGDVKGPGDTKGHSFWHIDSKPELSDKIIEKKLTIVNAKGDTVTIQTENDWITGETKTKLCEDVRTLTFGTIDDARYIDYDVTITATADQIEFGDTKEGTMGIRVPGTMKVDAVKNNPDWGGTIVNTNGDKDVDAWGKRAPWVDYFGPVEGETLGIAIMNHPSSFRYPTWWHVRTYGLFAANPFGLSYFEGKDKDGSLTLKKGESITLRYRIVFHKGDVDQAKIAQLFDAYSKTEK